MCEKHPDQIDLALQGLEEDRKTFLEMTLEMWRAHDADIYPLDLYANGAINRSLALSAGFQSMIEQRNILCAGPLVRLQLDTAIRFYAAFIVDNPHDLATAVLKGVTVRKLKDCTGQLMNDAHLVRCISKEYPWIQRVYEKTSNLIHMSDAHIMSSLDGANREKMSVGMLVGWQHKKLPDSLFLEAIAAFRAATDVFARYLRGWIITKDNPELAAEVRKAHSEEPQGKPPTK